MNEPRPASETPPANALARESSPYLLQHAHNPVDWKPWGRAAFEEARARDVPVFLSVGYSTCYWCHVMERESFEDPATAAVMNERFVNVKLDREERPDVDEVYMAAVQALTGRGGWPMSVFLEPLTLKPYWAGTYFPPRPAHGLPGFRQALEGMSDAWRQRRADVLKQAEMVAAEVRARLGAGAASSPVIGRPSVAMAAQTLLTIFDRVHGGFGDAPKFPQPVFLELLLAVRGRADDPSAREALDAALSLTLERMALGGIFDHAGGGFHRYSVDRVWLVPHFEKMLYDQAQLLRVYAQAAADAGPGNARGALLARTARRTADFVLRELTRPEGAFSTALDAEVDGREGLNYLWTPQQAAAALAAGGFDQPQIARWLAALGLDLPANFQDPHHPGEPPGWVLRLSDRPEALAGTMGLSPAAFAEAFDRVCAALLAERARRPGPRLDDKVLAAWNGLMIAGLADAGVALGEPRYVAAADRAADAVLSHLRAGDGPGAGLLRTARPGAPHGAAKIPGLLDDYAGMTLGLAALARAHEGEARRQRLAQAGALADAALARFGDDRGRLFDTADGADAELFIRPRSTYDGAMPCGASMMLHALLDLAELTGDRRRARQAARALAAMAEAIEQSPIATANATRALLRLIELDEPALVEALSAARINDAGRADGVGAGPGGLSDDGPGRDESPAGGEAPVMVFASESRVEVGPEAPVEFALRVQIAEGFHVAAADPGPGAMADGAAGVPMRLAVRGGTGVAVYADYPPGEPLSAQRADAPLVYRGVIEMAVALEREGEWTGQPELCLLVQPCTDTECLTPRVVALEVEVVRR